MYTDHQPGPHAQPTSSLFAEEERLRKANNTKQTIHNLVAAGVLNPYEDVSKPAKSRSKKSVGWRFSVKEISMRLPLLYAARFVLSLTAVKVADFGVLSQVPSKVNFR